MININIISTNKNINRYYKNHNSFIQKKINNLNKRFTKYKKKMVFFSLLISGDSEIKKLNKKFRKKDKSTDVLSFPFYKKNELRKKLKKEKEIYLGDVIININKIKKSNKPHFRKEFNKLLIHGLTHLFGYEHKKDKDYYIMKKAEKKFLSYLK